MRGRWLWLALAASVAVNLFLAGLWLGDRLTPSSREARARPPAAAFQRSPETRERLRALRRSARPEFAALREARRTALTALTAEPFDRAAAASALDAYHAAEGRLRTRLDAALLDVLQDMPAAERQALAPILLRAGRPPGGGRLDRPRQPR